jgi:hypothetical protein
LFFLLVYDRAAAKVESLQQLDPMDITEAFQRRLEFELDAFAQGREVEIVVLEAESEALLHRSHARYFDDLRAVLKEP